jgi:hypothetical protein
MSCCSHAQGRHRQESKTSPVGRDGHCGHQEKGYVRGEYWVAAFLQGLNGSATLKLGKATHLVPPRWSPTRTPPQIFVYPSILFNPLPFQPVRVSRRNLAPKRPVPANPNSVSESWCPPTSSPSRLADINRDRTSNHIGFRFILDAARHPSGNPSPQFVTDCLGLLQLLYVCGRRHSTGRIEISLIISHTLSHYLSCGLCARNISLPCLSTRLYTERV